MPSNFEAESRFADASRACQGDEPMVGGQPDHLPDIGVSTDQMRCPRREIRRSARRARNMRNRDGPCLLALAGIACTDLAGELVTSTHNRPDEAVI
jgi:hypothetical protein